MLCPWGISVPHKGRTSQIDRENTTRPYINHKYKRFLCLGEGIEGEVIRPAQGAMFILKYFCLSFGFLEVGNNIQIRWSWAVLFEQHNLNTITLLSNMPQYRVKEDISVVYHHPERDALSYFCLDLGRWPMSGYYIHSQVKIVSGRGYIALSI